MFRYDKLEFIIMQFLQKHHFHCSPEQRNELVTEIYEMAEYSEEELEGYLLSGHDEQGALLSKHDYHLPWAFKEEDND